MISYKLASRLAAALSLLVIAALPCASQTIAITGGKVYPVSGPPIENGTVIITNGKIAAVGANVAIPAGAQRIDATGKIVTPGFVDASTQLGVQEIAAVNDTRDMSARGKDNIAASFTVWEGLNPNSVLIGLARRADCEAARAPRGYEILPDPPRRVRSCSDAAIRGEPPGPASDDSSRGGKASTPHYSKPRFRHRRCDAARPRLQRQADDQQRRGSVDDGRQACRRQDSGSNGSYEQHSGGIRVAWPAPGKRGPAAEGGSSGGSHRQRRRRG